jgi:hypothetical protein
MTFATTFRGPERGISKRSLIVAALLVVAACSGGDSSSGTTTSTTSFSVYGDGGGTFGGSTGSTGTSSPADSDEVTVSASGVGGSVSVEEGLCATGTYELDSEDLWAQVIAASGEGGAEMVSGSVSLELADDLTARLVWNAWTFRLYFPGESETVLGTQVGEMIGSWAVDDDGAHSIRFDTDTTSSSFLLETAGGQIPVPPGDTSKPPVDIQLFARCGVDAVVLVVPDAETLAEMAWTFYRV